MANTRQKVNPRCRTLRLARLGRRVVVLPIDRLLEGFEAIFARAAYVRPADPRTEQPLESRPSFAPVSTALAGGAER